eukprot:COSAG01_NODE_3391_length_6151_cov_4.717944_10_plen_79_part_00
MFPSCYRHDKNRRRNEQKCRGISATAPVLIMKYDGRTLGQLEQLATELLYRLANGGARPLVYAGQGNEQLAKGLSRCG